MKHDDPTMRFFFHALSFHLFLAMAASTPLPVHAQFETNPLEGDALTFESRSDSNFDLPRFPKDSMYSSYRNRFPSWQVIIAWERFNPRQTEGWSISSAGVEVNGKPFDLLQLGPPNGARENRGSVALERKGRCDVSRCDGFQWSFDVFHESDRKTQTICRIHEIALAFHDAEGWFVAVSTPRAVGNEFLVTFPRTAFQREGTDPEWAGVDRFRLKIELHLSGPVKLAPGELIGKRSPCAIYDPPGAGDAGNSSPALAVQKALASRQMKATLLSTDRLLQEYAFAKSLVDGGGNRRDIEKNAGEKELPPPNDDDWALPRSVLVFPDVDKVSDEVRKVVLQHLQAGGTLFFLHSLPEDLAGPMEVTPSCPLQGERPDRIAIVPEFRAASRQELLASVSKEAGLPSKIFGLPERVSLDDVLCAFARPCGEKAYVLGRYAGYNDGDSGPPAIVLSEEGIYLGCGIVHDESWEYARLLAVLLGHLSPEMELQVVQEYVQKIESLHDEGFDILLSRLRDAILWPEEAGILLSPKQQHKLLVKYEDCKSRWESVRIDWRHCPGLFHEPPAVEAERLRRLYRDLKSLKQTLLVDP